MATQAPNQRKKRGPTFATSPATAATSVTGTAPPSPQPARILERTGGTVSSVAAPEEKLWTRRSTPEKSTTTAPAPSLPPSSWQRASLGGTAASVSAPPDTGINKPAPSAAANGTTARYASPAAVFSPVTPVDPARHRHEPDSAAVTAGKTKKPPSGGGSRRPCLPTAEVPPPLDPLDPYADVPRRALTEEEAWRCRIALQVFEMKLTQPREIQNEFKSVPPRLEVLKNT